MKTLGYYNGCYGELESMYVPMLDRASYFGDGVYDVAYGYAHTVFALSEHVDRFFQSARALDIKIEGSEQDLIALIERMIKKVDAKSVSVYFQASRGTYFREHAYDEMLKGNFSLMIRPAEMRDMTKPKKVMLYPDKRHGFSGLKTLNLLPNVLSAQAAKKNGCDEVILYRGDRITECAHSNVSILRKGVIITPPSDGTIVPGIAREHLKKQCETLGVQWEYAYISKEDLLNADEIILTSSGALCQDVGEIDGEKVGGKDPALLKELRVAVVKEYNEVTGASIEVGR